MLKMIPYHSLVLEQRAQQKEAIDGLVSCVQRALNIDVQLLVLVGVYQHEAMEVIVRQKQGLPCEPFAPACQVADGCFSECAERGWE